MNSYQNAGPTGRQPNLETRHYPDSVEVYQQSFQFLFMWYTGPTGIRFAATSRHGNGFADFNFSPKNWVA